MNALAWRRFARPSPLAPRPSPLAPRPSPTGDSRHAARSPWYRRTPLVLTVAILAHSALGMLLTPTYGYGAEVWGAIPTTVLVVGIAWMLGLRAGVLMGLFAMPLNTLLLNIQAEFWEPLSWISQIRVK